MPYSSLHKETNQALPEQLRDAYAKTSRYHLTSSYGLFRRMTGTDGGRPEVILEYADDLKGPWSEYQFLYKPGNVSAAPAFISKSTLSSLREYKMRSFPVDVKPMEQCCKPYCVL